MLIFNLFQSFLSEIRTKFLNMSLRPRLVIFYLASVLVPLTLFGIILYQMSINEMENEMKKVSLQSAIQINKVFDEYINQIDKIILSTYVNNTIPEYLRATIGYSEEQPSGSLWEKREAAYKNIEGLMTVNPDIWSISVVSLNKDIITISQNGYEKPVYDFYSDKYYEELRGSLGEMKLLPIHKTGYMFSPEREVFTLGRRYLDARTSESSGVNTYAGYILIECNKSTLGRICNKVEISKKGYVVILDNHKNFLYSTQKGDVDLEKNKKIEALFKKGYTGVQQVGNEKVVLISNSSEFTGWTVAGVIPYTEVMQSGKTIKDVFILLSLACIIMVMAASIVISRGVTKPIRILQKAIRDFEQGNTSVQVHIENYNEVGELSRSFNRLIDKVNSLIMSIRNIEIKKREAELDALRNQINPHFLYNTLDSIRMMAIISEQGQIADAVKALADLFRYSIRQKKDIVEIKHEVMHAKNYIYLQKMRYKNKFEVFYYIDNELLSMKTLKFTLQPIVENAIIHAFENRKEKGQLIISIKKQDNYIRFSVKDNGVGMKEDELEKLKANLWNFEGQGNQGIGLKNINERIALYFGEECGLVIASKPDEGTLVQFKIPIFNDEGWAIGNVISISGR